ncbi:MAG: ABC transporter permease [Nostocales cyanobacterium]|nr:MAG: ABC transporter permease [Nostocales cyanobacterium]TAF12597.1 MAG: ABC transporter permease [Nostocales cyanobacterium]
MNIPLLINRLGEWNPQLFRELQGRNKLSNLLGAVLSSLILQILFFLLYSQYESLDYVWRYIFCTFTIIFVFVLLFGGTYLIVSDLCKEENTGTLNFIRLSPQSATSIFIGKMLGVPSLIYLFVIIAIPLHLVSGFLTFNVFAVFSYYLLLFACCAFFYSLAVLFSLYGKWLNGRKPWLFSSAVGLFLFISMMLVFSSGESKFNHPGAWFRFFSPWDMIISVLFPGFFNENHILSIKLSFFYIPIDNNIVLLLGFFLIHYGICTYGILQAAKRIFHNQKATVISKKQSYLFNGFIQVMLLGLILQPEKAETDIIITGLTFINLNLIIWLTVFILPVTQNIQEWSRYSYQNNNQRYVKSYFKYFRKDLIWGEKSPAKLAIIINLLITTIPVIIWVTFVQENMDITSKLTALLVIAICTTWMLIFTLVIQLMSLSKNLHTYMWVFGSAGMTIFLPMVSYSLHIPDIFNVFTVLFTNFAVLSLLNWQFNQQVRFLGESATKALLTGD